MEANYVHKDSTTLVQDELVKNELNQIELQYNALKQQKFNELLKKNQDLKKQLEEYIKQNMKLKDELFDKRKEYQDTYKDVRIEIKEYKSQQKEFISYLENEIYSIEPKGTGINYNCEYDSEEDYINAMDEQSKLNTFKEILSKYREIIGSDINVSSIGDKDE